MLCASCGVTVAPGYPKCPKCHAALPRVTSPLHRQSAPVAGGTSASGGTGAGMWAVVAAIILIAGAVTFFVARGRGGEARAVADAGAGVAPDDGRGDLRQEPIPIDAGLGASAADDERAAQRRGDALDALSETLAAQRLWSSVDYDQQDDSIARVVSSHCDDPGLRQIIEQHREALSDAGFASVQCFTQHSSLAYERSL